MGQKRRLALAKMKNGQCGIVVEIGGGMGIQSKLESLGIRRGVVIRKKSALLARGPVIGAVGGTEIAMGYGMAAKIFVEVDEP